jgi:hypothetical protein
VQFASKVETPRPVQTLSSLDVEHQSCGAVRKKAEVVLVQENRLDRPERLAGFEMGFDRAHQFGLDDEVAVGEFRGLAPGGKH